MKHHLLKLILAVAFLLAEATPGARAAGLEIGWTNNMLRISGPEIPGGYVDTWYLEAFCRSASTHQAWDKTTIPHQTELVSASPDRKLIKLATTVGTNISVLHEIRAGPDEVTFDLAITNRGDLFQDVQWFQPCMRVDRFTALKQTNYIDRSFIFTERGLQRLNALPREEEAIYKGGQVYVPAGIPMEDVNPRPISKIRPANNLIGCVSADEKWLLATAWDRTQELFQGVIVCLHADPRIGGLKPHEGQRLKGKVYILPNDPTKLLERYARDFPAK
jgi:hypothetical protein